MNSYQVCCFIKEHSPLNCGERETILWFKRVCRIFKNEIPRDLQDHIVSVCKFNQFLKKLVSENEEKQKQKQKNDEKQKQKQKQNTDDYDAYIIRRDLGNRLANEVRLARVAESARILKNQQEKLYKHNEHESREIWGFKLKEFAANRDKALADALM